MESNKKISVILPNDLYDKVVAEAEKTGRSVSNWVRKAVKEEILRQEEDDG